MSKNTNKVKSNIVKFLRERFNKKNERKALTQEGLAKATNINRQKIIDLEAQEYTNLSVAEAKRIVRFFNKILNENYKVDDIFLD